MGYGRCESERKKIYFSNDSQIMQCFVSNYNSTIGSQLAYNNRILVKIRSIVDWIKDIRK